MSSVYNPCKPGVETVTQYSANRTEKGRHTAGYTDNMADYTGIRTTTLYGMYPPPAPEVCMYPDRLSTMGKPPGGPKYPKYTPDR